MNIQMRSPEVKISSSLSFSMNLEPENELKLNSIVNAKKEAVMLSASSGMFSSFSGAYKSPMKLFEYYI